MIDTRIIFTVKLVRKESIVKPNKSLIRLEAFLALPATEVEVNTDYMMTKLE